MLDMYSGCVAPPIVRPLWFDLRTSSSPSAHSNTHTHECNERYIQGHHGQELRDRDTDGDGDVRDAGGSERVYVLHDANFNVTRSIASMYTGLQTYWACVLPVVASRSSSTCQLADGSLRWGPMAIPDVILKVRIWTKIILLGLVVLYTLLFVWNNSDEQIDVWLFFNTNPRVNVLIALLGAFVLGAMMTVLARMVWNTVAQMRTVSERNRTARLEREIADMRTKAGSLRTRESQ